MSDFQFLQLTTKPGAQLCYRFYPSSSTKTPLLLAFLNGLGLPQANWEPAITKLQELRKDRDLPPILTYDRFGQGQTTDRDPHDKDAADPSHGHDCTIVVKDLRQFLSQIVLERMNISDLDSVATVFVANSVGCALARLYADEYPGTVAGMLFLDSVLANSDFVSIFPDPDAKDFEPNTLPDGVAPDDLRTAREKLGKMFHPSVGSREGLSRRNLAALLPDSDAPLLKGSGGRGPFLTVLGHEFETFAEESERFGQPKALTNAYTNPYWQTYNEGLVQITEQTRVKGPLQAPHAGHFIQRDNPDYVALELDLLLSKVM